jgi:hypothetical protein
MVALHCLLVAACLIFVLLAPGEWFHSRRFGLITTILFIVGIPVLVRVAERSRIREDARQMLATVIRLRRMPLWKQGWDYFFYRWSFAPKYEVFLSDFAGRQFRAVCRSGFLRGVQWLEIEPIPSTEPT